MGRTDVHGGQGKGQARRWVEDGRKWKQKAQLCVLSKIGAEKECREKVRWAPGVARKKDDVGGKVHPCRWRLFTKKVSGSCFPRQRASERSGIELNRIGTGLALDRWWLGYGLANGAETAVMTPVAAGIGLQRQNNKQPDAATGRLLLPLEFRAAGG